MTDDRRLASTIGGFIKSHTNIVKNEKTRQRHYRNKLVSDKFVSSMTFKEHIK